MSENSWKDQIDSVLRRYVKHEQDRDDARQEAVIALWQTPVQSAEEAEKLVKSVVRKYLRKLYPVKTESLDELKHHPIVPVEPDFSKVTEAVERLPAKERTVIRMIFGIGEEQKTSNQTAFILGKSKFWVHRVKMRGLNKLKEILNG